MSLTKCKVVQECYWRYVINDIFFVALLWLSIYKNSMIERNRKRTKIRLSICLIYDFLCFTKGQDNVWSSYSLPRTEYVTSRRKWFELETILYIRNKLPTFEHKNQNVNIYKVSPGQILVSFVLPLGASFFMFSLFILCMRFRLFWKIGYNRVQALRLGT